MFICIAYEKCGSELYHYTSIDALAGIIGKGELWFGNTSNMNDKNECKDFIYNLQEALLTDLADKYKEDCKRFFDELDSRVTSNFPFAMCLSKLKDNAAQWERYASNAMGVCLTFDTALLYRAVMNQPIIFNNVFYEYNIRRNELYDILKTYFETGQFPYGLSSRKGLQINIEASSYIRKHISFKSEEEVRIVTLGNNPIGHSGIEYKNIRGSIKKTLVVNICELCMENEAGFESLIKETTIGPRSGQSMYDLSEYLCSKGFNKLAKNVKKSECPLR